MPCDRRVKEGLLGSSEGVSSFITSAKSHLDPSAREARKVSRLIEWSVNPAVPFARMSSKEKKGLEGWWDFCLCHCMQTNLRNLECERVAALAKSVALVFVSFFGRQY